ncbi:MAG: hypothetical protein HOV80_35310 [Polyangiaceae bacterium]|nr:hypothetical protein [Polyangiaceae bacterium]
MSEQHIDSIRLRPGMYMGDIHDGSAIAHMIWEAVANSVDEHLAGHCTQVTVTIEEDASVSVEDDGRGVPVHDVAGIPFAQRALTEFHNSPTLDGHAPHEHIASSGLGLLPVNALSSWLELTTFRDGGHYVQRYERGRPTAPLERIEPTGRTGTRLRFHPDPSIFGGVWFDPGQIATHLRELSFLLPKLTLRFTDRRQHSFHEPLGLASYVRTRLRSGIGPELPMFTLVVGVGDIVVEVAATWGPAWGGSLESFANVQRTTGGGTHVRGLLLGLVDGLRKATPTSKRRKQLEGALTEGLVAAVCVRLNDPTYDSPTKSILSTPRVTGVVRRAVREGFEHFLAREPAVLAYLRNKID